MKRPIGTSYYHFDGQMSTRKLSDAAQTVTDSYTYDAFGIELDRTGATINDYKYTGEQYDANIGFYYLRARCYCPEMGRFLTMDVFSESIFEPHTLHKCLYARSNPINYADPTGMFSPMTVVVAMAIGVILGSIIGAIVAFLLGYRFTLVACRMPELALGVSMRNRSFDSLGPIRSARADKQEFCHDAAGSFLWHPGFFA